MHHCNEIKNILRYLHDKIYLESFFRRNQDYGLIGYADAGYLPTPHNGRSQIRFVFLHRETAISWKCAK
jgi:hypothetical protein